MASLSASSIRKSSAQRYERNLEHLGPLRATYVDLIDIKAVDKLVVKWRSDDYPKPAFCKNFDHELGLLQTILTYYHQRENPAYAMPILRDHFESATIRINESNEVQALEIDEFLKFDAALEGQRHFQYSPLACTQFGLTLRIGEACGLQWPDFNFEKRIVEIARTVSWDRETWEGSINPVKNGKKRTLAVPDFVYEKLMKLRAHPDYQEGGDGLIFSVECDDGKPGRPFQSKVVDAAYARARKVCGYDHVTGTHFIRKSGATLANDMAEDIRAVQEQRWFSCRSGSGKKGCEHPEPSAEVETEKKGFRLRLVRS